MKAIIWDLDETLWKGTVHYGETVKLKAETKEVLKQLHKLGIVQCICSFNPSEYVLKKLEEFDMIKYFTIISARMDKGKHYVIKDMIKTLNFYPEDVLFVDDIPLNREMVKMFTGCNVDYDENLYNIMKYFDTDRLRLMKEHQIRVTAEKEWKGDRKEFLKIIKNKIKIKLATEDEIPRITNLANRTNELNAARNRYTEVEIEKFIKDKRQYTVYVAYLSDKFGDYGLVGEIIIKKEDNWDITDVCVSCRTMGRDVGSSLFKYVIKKVKKIGNITTLTGRVIPNQDNFRMAHLFERCGFKKEKIYESIIYYTYKIK